MPSLECHPSQQLRDGEDCGIAKGHGDGTRSVPATFEREEERFATMRKTCGCYALFWGS